MLLTRDVWPYDVVQIWSDKDEDWKDYATIRDDVDVVDAKRIVLENPDNYRVVSGHQPYPGHEVKVG